MPDPALIAALHVPINRDYRANRRHSGEHPQTKGKPTARQWLLHIGLFLLTVVTTTIFGIVIAGPDLNPAAAPPPALRGLAGSIFLIPWIYVTTVVAIIRYALVHREFLFEGLKFSGSLLAILTAHESGHYLFCRYYGVDATLPFFIPQPPLLWPGTFGAFIRMKSPVPSRRALFDIGLAGPLAGFIVLLPIAFAGVLTVHHVPLIAGGATSGGSGIIFNDPLLFRLIARAFRIDLENSEANSFYLAAWFGALVTALNLIPVGQLGWRSRNLCHLRPPGSSVDWPGHVRSGRGHLSPGVDLARQSGMVCFHFASGSDAARTASAAGADGTARSASDRHRDRDPNRLCALLFAFSDYDNLLTVRTPLACLAPDFQHAWGVRTQTKVEADKMKMIVVMLVVLVSGFAALTPGKAGRAPQADPIETIRQHYANINKNVPLYRRVKKSLSGFSGEGGELVAFFTARP